MSSKTDNSPVYIRLANDDAEKFEQIKEQLTKELGYSPKNPEALGYIIATYPDLDENGEDESG